jgi:uncharacterized C2H2 Zn-finger protein
MKITEALMSCPKCGWTGKVIDCEPDVDGDGSLGCPKCLAVCYEWVDQFFKHN